MPDVKPGESRESYVSRCIAEITKSEGLDAKAAAGKCEGMYDEHVKREKKHKKMRMRDDGF